MDEADIQTAFDDVLDQAIVFHDFADYTRDYDVFTYATAGSRTGIVPQHLQYRFKYCIRVAAVCHAADMA